MGCDTMLYDTQGPCSASLLTHFAYICRRKSLICTERTTEKYDHEQQQEQKQWPEQRRQGGFGNTRCRSKCLFVRTLWTPVCGLHTFVCMYVLRARKQKEKKQQLPPCPSLPFAPIPTNMHPLSHARTISTNENPSIHFLPPLAVHLPFSHLVHSINAIGEDWPL